MARPMISYRYMILYGCTYSRTVNGKVKGNLCSSDLRPTYDMIQATYTSYWYHGIIQAMISYHTRYKLQVSTGSLAIKSWKRKVFRLDRSHFDILQALS